MNMKFLTISISILLIVGCGNSSSNNTGTGTGTDTDTDTENNNITSFQEIGQKYSDIVLIYRATESFCDSNTVFQTIQNSPRVLNYHRWLTAETAECSSFGKTVQHCDTYIAENEPGNITCIIGVNLK